MTDAPPGRLDAKAGSSAGASGASGAVVMRSGGSGCRFTKFATATCGTIRLKLLKIGAQVRRSVRRIKIA